jgi:hypothetical protein
MKAKTYSMSSMKHRDAINLVNTLNALGFGPNDYRIVSYGSHMQELKVSNRDLHWILKSLLRLERLN